MFTLVAVLARTFSEMPRKPLRPLVLCGPSGSGKSTLLRRLLSEFPLSFGFSVSHTTRSPRPRETNGVEYFFVSREEMLAMVTADEFIEIAEFGGNMYGTSKKAVRAVQDEGKICILDIEIQGVEQIRKTDLNPVLIFNNPPSIEELRKRLRERNTETEENLQARLEAAEREIAYGLTPGNFDLIIHNVDMEKSYKQFRDYIVDEYKLTPPAPIYIEMANKDEGQLSLNDQKNFKI